ncbi:MAG: hypothetical protein LBP53_06955 [Candidatus Peribacteria bacterium]|jgi:isoleucyl-tRNA synthetase|nr:hypothetical protein [Candidatus Peribacteria bacterium]
MVEYGLKVSPTVFVEEGKMYLFLQDLLLQQVLLKKYLYTELIQYTPLLDKNGHKFSYKSLQVNQLFVLLDEYGPSPIRLALLIQKSIDLNIIHWYDAFLRQIWNGIRYLVLSVDKHRVSFSDARNEFIEKADYLDKWIMCEFYELWNTFEHKKNGDYQQLLDMFPLIQQFIQKKLL